ncbi:bifunctional (p)ppGpp synthetase/guanosine-3',5'-bis(diphosphate) 3'-pyrophosphohydrolase [bacterium]|nr:bifunctional (p)ppGpp synthetase/guanosine-3',5'-bis(diphosphate) 3'-pyrophosphohydrolase [candidate division CSSED10-310 bacterium]
MFDSFIATVTGYNPRADTGLLYEIGRMLERLPENSLEPYSFYALGIQNAQLLAALQTDVHTLGAAMLLPACDRQALALDRVATQFGSHLTELVRSTLHLGRLPYIPFGERHAKNFRHLLRHRAEDYRSILLLLSWQAVVQRQRALAAAPVPPDDGSLEYIEEILIPLADEWSIAVLKRQLDDILLYWRSPDVYTRLAGSIAARTAGADALVRSFSRRLSTMLEEKGIDARISGRVKTVASTWFKIEHRVGSLEEVYDLIAVRILVEREELCYDVISLLHANWEYLPEKYKDYIKQPKQNGYQSIHSTILGPGDRHMEIQVRTFEMHVQAERGVAAHWYYKKQIGRGQLPQATADSKRSGRKDDTIFVITPKGEIIALPEGATGLDLAFAIHSEVGFRATGVRIHESFVSLRKPLASGDVVEVVTMPRGKPSKDWLSFVKTRNAREKIERWFAREGESRLADKGTQILARQAKRLGYTITRLEKEGYLRELVQSFRAPDLHRLVVQLGREPQTADRVLERLLALVKPKVEGGKIERRQPVRETAAAPSVVVDPAYLSQRVLVEGKAGLRPKLSRCCNPQPPDAIIAFITRGRGVTIHTTSCPNIKRLMAQAERIRRAEWDTDRSPSSPREDE